MYDARNRLVEVKDGSDTVASYDYNGLGWRVQADVDTDGDATTDETRYVYYSQQWQRVEVRVDGTSSSDLDRQYLWGQRYIDALVCRDRATDRDGTTEERLFALQGANFNVWASVDETGAVQERFAYTPYRERSVQDSGFGADPDSESDVEFRIGHQGLRHSGETGLIANRRRVLHPLVGRFGARDPLRYIDGMNLLEYLGSSPSGGLDPTGSQSQTSCPSCNRWKNSLLSNNSRVRVMLNIAKFLYSGIFNESCLDSINCEKCKSSSLGGYYDPGSRDITLCKHNLRTKPSLKTTLVHELAHAISVCGKGSFDCKKCMIEEKRAYYYAGQCSSKSRCNERAWKSCRKGLQCLFSSESDWEDVGWPPDISDLPGGPFPPNPF